MNSYNNFVLQQVSNADIKSPAIPSNLAEQYAQCGEDLVIQTITTALHRAGLIPDWNSLLTIEIGANHAFGGSNSYLLERKFGVQSILVEANPDLLADLRQARPLSKIIHAAICPDDRDTVVLHRSHHHELSSLELGFVTSWHDGRVGLESSIEVPAMRIGRLLQDHLPINKQVLLLSIDIEGLDLLIVQDIDFTNFRPIMVMLEPSEHYRAGEGTRMIDIMRARGYVLLGQTDVNLLFIDVSLLKQLAVTVPEQLEVPSIAYGASIQPPPPPPSDTLLERAIADNPVNKWQLDETFINQALESVKSRGMLTLDIFDNAITRLLASPADVFAETERRLQLIIGDAAYGFAAAREQAEINARSRQHTLHGSEEVTFKQIYQELPSLLPQPKIWDLAPQIELEVEYDALIAVPDILELTHRVRAANIPYAFVSDMYLPAEFLEKILTKLGYSDWTTLYVSSELEATKATGRIWETIAEHHSLSSLVHIGDNQHSDVTTPLQHGIHTISYQRALSTPRFGTQLTPDVVPYSIWQRHVELESKASLAPCTEQQRWYDLGRGFGGFLLSAFTQWLAERVTQHKIERLYFCARDGHLMQQAWVASGLADKIPVEHRYLYISRASLNLVNAVCESKPNHLNAATLSFLSSSLGETNISTALERADLHQVDSLVEAMLNEFGSLETKLDQSTSTRFEKVLQQHSHAIYAVLLRKYDLCKAYLTQEGFGDDCRWAMVDMGWHGNLQRSLAGICKTIWPNSKLPFGFYYGLWPAASRSRYLAGPMEACFSSSFLAPELQSELHQGVDFLEEIHSAAHGTTLGYYRENDLVLPTLKATTSAQSENDIRAKWFQQGTIAGVTELFGQTGPISAPVITPKAAKAALGTLFLSPSTDELNLLATIGHCATFDHSSLDPLISMTLPRDIDDMRHNLVKTNWPLGQLCYWWRNGDDNHRSWVRTLATEMYSHFGERTLRQFH